MNYHAHQFLSDAESGSVQLDLRWNPEIGLVRVIS